MATGVLKRAWDKINDIWVDWKTTDGAAHITLIDPATGLPFGTMNGGIKVADVYHPARDIYLDFFHGADDAFTPASGGGVLVANQWTGNNAGVNVDMRYLNVNHRTIVIVNGDASPSFQYKVLFSRNGVPSGVDVPYEVIGATASVATITRVNLPASLGYDIFAHLYLNPDVGQTGTKLQFKTFLVGRGG